MFKDAVHRLENSLKLLKEHEKEIKYQKKLLMKLIKKLKTG
jgi:hypothetical protein